ncbi:MAG: phosphotransferase family protein [Xanthomonadales bacterium]|nr:phosphotransferase family protein [Xanthomonadales bacterium]
MSGALDEAGAVRVGEELDAERLDAFLRVHIEGLDGLPAIRQFAGGASNLTYLVRYPNRDLVLRRPPFGARAKSAHDMLREARIMVALKPHYPYVPEVLALGEQVDVIGCEFYVMQRIVGVIPRRDLPPEPALDAGATRQLCRNVIERLVELHALDARQPELAAIGRGEGYVARQLEGWTERWRRALTDDVGDCARVIAWLEERRPARDAATCVIHNDFRFDNLVLDAADPMRVIGVLDWEMATLGDPLMDLGNALAYWVQADDDAGFRSTRRQPTDAPGMLTRDEVVAYYAERSGRRIDDFAFYRVFGLFRLAVIVQQIYRRWRDGHAANPQFAQFGAIANLLGARCLATIDRAPR